MARRRTWVLGAHLPGDSVVAGYGVPSCILEIPQDGTTGPTCTTSGGREQQTDERARAKVTPAETEHRLLYELGNQQWNIPRLRLLLEELLPTHTSLDDFEVTHTFLHLGRRTMRLNARRFALEGADTLQILLAIEDITARKEAEAALQAQRDWFDGTLSSIGDGGIATDVHGAVIFLNPVAEVLTGWSRTETQGRPLVEVFRIISEQTRQSVEDDPVRRVLQEGRALGLANHTLLITRYGGEIPIADSATPIPHAQWPRM